MKKLKKTNKFTDKDGFNLSTFHKLQSNLCGYIVFSAVLGAILPCKIDSVATDSRQRLKKKNRVERLKKNHQEESIYKISLFLILHLL